MTDKDISDISMNSTAGVMESGSRESGNATTVAVSEAMTEHDFRILVRFYIHAVLGTIICLIGLIGSMLSFVVLAKDKHCAISTFLLQTLCLSDNFFLIFEFLNVNLVFAFWYWDIEDGMHQSWFYVYIITRPLLYISNFVNLWLTVLIAGMRYIAVCIPLRASRLLTLGKTKMAVAIVIASGFIFHASCFLENKVEYWDGPASKYYVSERSFTQEWSYQVVHNIILYAIFYFVIPLILLIFFTANLIITFRKGSIARRNRHLGRSAEDQVTLVMILIVCIFVICQTPGRCLHLMHWIAYHLVGNRVGFVMNEIFRLLFVINCSVNFFIYCTCRRKFRHSLQKMCCGGDKGFGVISSFRSTSSRRTTNTMVSMKQIDGSQPS